MGFVMEENREILVSVIVPVYMVERWLRSCLDSILSQSLREIEVICVDDASPDSSGEILDEYALRDDRVKVIHLKENGRQGHARNCALEAASGRYIYFLDSDDMVRPEALETLYGLAERERLDGVFFDAEAVYDQDYSGDFIDRDCGLRKGVYPAETVTGRELFRAFCEYKEWYVYVQRQFWRREHLMKHDLRFAELPIHEDEDFSFRATLLAERVRYLPQTFFLRRIRNGSSMTALKKVNSFFGYFATYCLMRRFLAETDDCDPACIKLMQHVFMLCYYMYHSVDGSPELHALFAGSDYEEEFREYVELRSREEVHPEQDAFGIHGDLAQFEGQRREQDKEVFAQLPPLGFIRLYGAGKIARSVYWRLSRLGFRVTDFLVTDREGNPSEIFGRPVHVFSEAEPIPETTVLVAMARENHHAVSRALEERGWEHYTYANNLMEGPFPAR